MAKTFFSRKYAKIFTFDSIVKVFNKSSDGRKNKLMIHTANGIYLGNLKEVPNFDDLEVQEGDDILTCFNKLYLSTLDKYENVDNTAENTEIVENPITIELEDVELITSNKTINMPFVTIFVDQIVGVSLGNI